MGRRILGTPGAVGVAVGPVWRYEAAGAGETASEGKGQGEGGAADPVAALTAAAQEAARQLESLAGKVRDLGRAEDAGIFEAQAMMATDPELLDQATALVNAGKDRRPRRRPRPRPRVPFWLPCPTSCLPPEPPTYATWAPASPASCGAKA